MLMLHTAITAHSSSKCVKNLVSDVNSTVSDVGNNVLTMTHKPEEAVSTALCRGFLSKVPKLCLQNTKYKITK